MIEYLQQFKYFLFDPVGLQELIEAFGLPILILIVFAETGLFVGFFLPGDSLLFIAGFSTGLGTLGCDFLTLNLTLMAAAIFGDTVGYWFGYKAGHALYNRPDSFFFKKKHALNAKLFYEKYGGKTIIMARFVPIVRTFAPMIAGVAEMKYRTFMSYNVFGGIFWVFAMTGLGYKLGQLSWVAKNLEKAVLVVIFLSILPMVIEYIRHRRR